MQTDLHSIVDDRLHVGLIMDGNGRWATARGEPRLAGHCAGSAVIGSLISAAPMLGVSAMSLYAFSSDNWRRPAAEVGGLMDLIEAYLRGEIRPMAAAGVRLKVIGRRDRLPASLLDAILQAEQETAQGTRLDLRIAIDYSAREAIVAAARAGATGQEAIRDALGTRDVDLLIRTGGEQRLSDFLLWECAYAELHFTKVMWPDFSPVELTAAITDFRSRTRRFGGLPEVA